MPLLFLSYARKNSLVADKVCDWLGGKGWKDVFRDTDPDRGLAVGQEWEIELYNNLEKTAGAILLISPEWQESEWCRIELTRLRERGKLIFPVFIASTVLTQEYQRLLGQFQSADISTPALEAKGFDALERGLKRSRLEPRDFDIDPRRSPYRGLAALEEEDAAVFFGRDDEIARGLESMRQMRDGASNRVLFVLGASGSGKSSFLRAGLLSRVRRDTTNYCVLPLIRPEQAAISGPRGIARAFGTADFSGDAQMKKALDALRRAPASGRDSKDAEALTLVAAVDQAEELFSAENSEGQHGLEVLTRMVGLDPRLILLLTIRSDTYQPLQTAPALAGITPRLFNLGPISRAAFNVIIEGPGKLAKPQILFHPELVARLIKDLGTEDALPLLAFALQRLEMVRRGSELLTIEDYRGVGELKGIVEGVAEIAFEKAQRELGASYTRARLEGMARRAFIPALVRIESKESQPLRRTASMADLPKETHPLVRQFVDERLLVTDGLRVEVAHETILRQWKRLADWIEEEREGLILLESVLRASEDWAREPDPARKADFLAHRGSRYDDVVSLRTRGPDWDGKIAVADAYLAACKKRDEDDFDALETRDKRNLIQKQRLFAGNVDMLRREFRTDAAMRIGLIGELDLDALNKGVAADPVRYAHLARAAHEGRLLLMADRHPKPIPCIAFHPDGRHIATGSQDGVARLIEVDSGRIVREFVGHRPGAWISGLAFSGDGRLLATGSQDRTVRVWATDSGREQHRFAASDDVRCLTVARAAGLIAAGCSDGKVCLWTLDGRDAGTVETGDRQAVLGVALHAEGTLLAVGGQAGSVRVIDTRTKTTLWEALDAHRDYVSSVDISPDGTTLVSASHDLTVRLWDVATGAPSFRISGHTEQVRAVRFGPDRTRIATAGGDATVRVWDTASGLQVLVLGGHDGWVQCVSFAPDGRRLASGGFDSTARVWDTNEGFETRKFEGLKGFISALAMSPDGKTFAVGGPGDAVRILSSATGEVGRDLSQTIPSALHLSFTTDGNALLATGPGGRATVVSRRSGAIIGQTVTAPPPKDTAPGALLPNAQLALLAHGTDLVEWDFTTSRAPRRLAAASAPITFIAAAQDGSKAAFADTNGAIHVWDIRRQVLAAKFESGIGPIQCLRFDSNGGHLAAGGQVNPYSLRFWRTSDWMHTRTFAGHTDQIWSLSFSPDGHRLATACRDRHVRIYDIETGVVTGDYFLPQQVQAVAIAPDGTFVVAGGRNGMLRILDSVFPATLRGGRLAHAIARYRIRGAETLSEAERALIEQFATVPATPNLSQTVLEVLSKANDLTSGHEDRELNRVMEIWRDHRRASFERAITIPPPAPHALRTPVEARSRRWTWGVLTMASFVVVAVAAALWATIKF